MISHRLNLKYRILFTFGILYTILLPFGLSSLLQQQQGVSSSLSTQDHQNNNIQFETNDKVLLTGSTKNTNSQNNPIQNSSDTNEKEKVVVGNQINDEESKKDLPNTINNNEGGGDKNDNTNIIPNENPNDNNNPSLDDNNNDNMMNNETQNQNDVTNNNPEQQQQNQQQHNVTNNPDDTPDSYDSVPLPILLLGFIVAALLVRKKLMDGAIGIHTLDSTARRSGRSFFSGSNNSGSSQNGNDEYIGSNATVSSDFTYGLSVGGERRFSGRRHHVNPEIVPLSSTQNDDEWGWEDGSTGGDVELGDAATNTDLDQEDEELQMALALSLSERLPPTTPPLVRKSSNTPKNENPITNSSSSLGASLVKNNEKSISKPTTTATTLQEKSYPRKNDLESVLAEQQQSLGTHIPAGQHISSFGKRSTYLPKAPSSGNSKNNTTSKTVKNNSNDDIFASMGLSSLPSRKTPTPIQTTPNVKSATSSYTTSTPVFRSTSPSLAALSGTSSNNVTPFQQQQEQPERNITSNTMRADIETSEHGSNWGDDSDLDDLLDD